MISAVLVAAAWVASGLYGAPIDPFAALPALAGLRRPGAVWLVTTVLVLAPLAAAAMGDPPVDRLVRYALIAAVAHRLATSDGDRTALCVLAVGAGLVGASAAQLLLAASDVTAPPSTTAATVLWTMAFTALLALARRARPEVTA